LTSAIPWPFGQRPGAGSLPPLQRALAAGPAYVGPSRPDRKRHVIRGVCRTASRCEARARGC
jgi:hypothetical protein